MGEPISATEITSIFKVKIDVISAVVILTADLGHQNKKIILIFQ